MVKDNPKRTQHVTKHTPARFHRVSDIPYANGPRHSWDCRAARGHSARPYVMPVTVSPARGSGAIRIPNEMARLQQRGIKCGEMAHTLPTMGILERPPRVLLAVVGARSVLPSPNNGRDIRKLECTKGGCQIPHCCAARTRLQCSAWGSWPKRNC